MNILRKVLIISFFTLYTSYFLTAQIAINADGTSPDASAMLEIASSDKGFLAPRMTTTERTAISSPATGLLVYDTDMNSFWYYEGSKWIEITIDQNENNFIEPKYITSIDIGTSPVDMEVSGDYLYIVEQDDSKVSVYDISNQFKPVLVSSLSFSSGNALKGIAINGNYAFVVGNNVTNEFKVIDISNPTNISLVGEFDIGANLITIEIDGDYAYTVDQTDKKLRVIDISTPSNPTEVESITIDINLAGLDVVTIIDGNYLYIGYRKSSGHDELSVIDISTPTSLSIIGSLVLGNYKNISELIKHEDYLYVLRADEKIQIVDVSTPSSPTLSSTTFSSEPYSAVLYGDNLYVDNGLDHDLEVYDVSSPTTPASTYMLDKANNTTASDMLIKDGHLYAIEDAGNLVIYQIASIGITIRNMDGDNDTYDLYDNLGSHTATSNINLSDNWLSNDGDDEGISVDDDGKVTISDDFLLNGNWLSNDGGNEGISVDDNGNTTLSGTLTIGSSYTLPNTDGNASQILTTDGNGSLTWENKDTAVIALSDADGDTKIQVEESNDEDIIRFDLGGTEYMQLNSSELNVNGNIAFGASGDYILDEGSWQDANIVKTSGSGTFAFHASGSGNTLSLQTDGDLTYVGTLTDISDRRLKENILPIENALEKLQQIQGYTYNLILDQPDNREYGVMAQDLQLIFPEMVKVVDKKEGYLGVSYIQLIPVLLEATKEQQITIEKQQAEIKELKVQLQKINELEAKLETLLNH